MKMINKFEGEYRFLSNFHVADVEFEGEIYPSSEHAFQAAKTLDKKKREKIRKAEHPSEAKRLGKPKNLELREDWEEVKTAIMFKIVHNKFQRHPELAQKLMDTHPAELIEGNWWHDTCWGVCNGVGENRLGHILMLVRHLLLLQRITGILPPVNFNETFLGIKEE